MTRAFRYLAPPAVCLALFWRVPFIWFRIDDFAWLGLWQQVHSLRDLIHALFAPAAEGIIRVLSQSGYFIVLGGLFGTYAAPFRAMALGTWFVDLALIQAIGGKLTGSRAAGLLAALLRTASATLATPLMWASAYNQLLVALCVLGAFYSRLRWLESGESKWRWLEAIAFLAGFGALEIIVVYPAVVLLHAWAIRARDRWQSWLWMFLPSALFTAAHLFWIPKENSAAYQLVVDARLPGNLLQYFLWAAGPSEIDSLEPRWRAFGMMATWAAGATLACWTAWQIWKGNRTPVFCCGWFLLFLAPVLPLVNHVSAYYLVVPGIGLAWIAGSAAVSAARLNGPLRAPAIGAAALLAGSFAAGSMNEIKVLTSWHLRLTSKMRIAVRGVESMAAAYPGTVLVLQGVDAELMRHGFLDDPFRLAGIDYVYLAPGNDQLLDLPEFQSATRFRTTRGALRPLLESGKARVLNVADARVQDVTRAYRKVLETEILAAHRERVELSDPLYAARLGEGWYPIENGARWMAKRAALTLGGPRTPAEKLFVSGYAAAAVLKPGPLTLRVLADGKPLGAAYLTTPDKPFEVSFAVPPSLAGQYAMHVTLECSRTVRPDNDPRDLGIVIRTVELR
jgi:hypothetical protein